MADVNNPEPATSKQKSDKDAAKAVRRKHPIVPGVRPSKQAKHVNSPLALDEALLDSEFIKDFRQHWDNDGTDTTKEWPTVTMYKSPFQLCAISKLLQDPEAIEGLLDEIKDIGFIRKHMDLYEFFQSTDLANMTSKLLVEFHKQLETNIMPLVAKLTNRQLTKVSSSCSIYNIGDHLLVHDDRLADRVIAYVFYLSPWEDAQEWSSKMGGALELFSCNEAGDPVYPIVKTLPPKNNQFVFFKVSERSFHQVGEVTSLSYPRITINGWFHGPPEDENTIPEDHAEQTTIPSMLPPSNEDVILSEWISESYLKSKMKKSIQQHIEETSEASLQSFLIQDYFDHIYKQLETDDACQWIRDGPANKRNYEVLHMDRYSGPVRDLMTLIRSPAFFHLLHEYTELDLSGPKAVRPTCTIDICRVTSNSYTMLDDATLKLDSSLDLIMYFNPHGVNQAGMFTYLNPTIGNHEDEESSSEDSDNDDSTEKPMRKPVLDDSDDEAHVDDDEDVEEEEDEEEDDDDRATNSHTEETSVLLTVSPKSNALNLVYRCRQTTKFLNYISKRTMASHEYSYILTASYRE